MRLAVDLRPRQQIFERRRARHLVVVAARHVAHAAHLAHAGAVEAERVEAAARELEPAEEDAHLLGVVHAVDHDHRRARSRLARFHEQRRQGRALVGHFDELDVVMAQPDALVPHLVGVRALRLLLGPRLDEALGVIVVDACAQVVVARRDLVALGQGLVAAALDHAHRARAIPPTRPCRDQPRLVAPAASRSSGRSPPARRPRRVPCP